MNPATKTLRHTNFLARYRALCCVAFLDLTFGLGSCVTVGEFEKQTKNTSEQETAIQELNRKLEYALTRTTRLENELRDLISRQYCKDADVRELIRTCATNGKECHAASIEPILNKMIKFPFTMLYFGLGKFEPAPERIAHLREMFQKHTYTMNTKLLLLALPDSPAASDYQEAERVVLHFQEYLRKLASDEFRLPPNAIRFIPPQIMGCQKSKEIMSVYTKSKNGTPKPSEPIPGQPKIVVWAFLMDC